MEPLLELAVRHPLATIKIYVDDIIVSAEGTGSEVRSVVVGAASDILEMVPTTLLSQIAHSKVTIVATDAELTSRICAGLQLPVLTEKVRYLPWWRLRGRQAPACSPTENRGRKQMTSMHRKWLDFVEHVFDLSLRTAEKSRGTQR